MRISAFVGLLAGVLLVVNALDFAPLELGDKCNLAGFGRWNRLDPPGCGIDALIGLS